MRAAQFIPEQSGLQIPRTHRWSLLSLFKQCSASCVCCIRASCESCRLGFSRLSGCSCATENSFPRLLRLLQKIQQRAVSAEKNNECVASCLWQCAPDAPTFNNMRMFFLVCKCFSTLLWHGWTLLISAYNSAKQRSPGRPYDLSSRMVPRRTWAPGWPRPGAGTTHSLEPHVTILCYIMLQCLKFSSIFLTVHYIRYTWPCYNFP